MTEIDNDMIERARKAMSKHHMHWFKDEAIRAGITAALSPPKPDPEIEVSEGMEVAAMNCANSLGELIPRNFRKYYRAMRAQEVKEAPYAAKPAPQGVSSAAPVKETGGGVGGVRFYAIVRE